MPTIASSPSISAFERTTRTTRASTPTASAMASGIRGCRDAQPRRPSAQRQPNATSFALSDVVDGEMVASAVLAFCVSRMPRSISPLYRICSGVYGCGCPSRASPRRSRTCARVSVAAFSRMAFNVSRLAESTAAATSAVGSPKRPRSRSSAASAGRVLALRHPLGYRLLGGLLHQQVIERRFFQNLTVHK